ncbi:MAG: hypothetical protein QGI34_04870 [Candidatus Latescibacteria bacterium]|jgi:hypothetical protein|nr:hypothetical protein [Candidatus Latescibacterota bacterium]|tara:strand:+ start:130 stop:291 length:162 start_codon:yes stop_codon:yes gene_type:complete
MGFRFPDHPKGHQPWNAYPDIQDCREQAPRFTDLSIWAPQSVNPTKHEGPVRC